MTPSQIKTALCLTLFGITIISLITAIASIHWDNWKDAKKMGGKSWRLFDGYRQLF